jgi:PTH1 family peptidyl-tRNA hydrolase
MKLIVGLGNPGKEYAHTRHNIGWLLLDQVARTLEATPFQAQRAFQAEIAEARAGTEKILFVKPTTYMNNSGTAVQLLLSYYKLTTEDLLIVQDEMDYPLGKFAFASSGGAAGHNGIGSIHTSLGRKELGRLRLGIGRPTPPLKSQDYVLQTFSSEETEILNESFKEGVRAIQDWITHGLTRTMNSWNGVEHGVDRRTDRASRLPTKPEDRE